MEFESLSLKKYWEIPFSTSTPEITALDIAMEFDGTPMVAMGGSDGFLRIADLNKRTVLGEVQTHSNENGGWINTVNWLKHNGCHAIATGGDADGTIRIWQITPRGELKKLGQQKVHERGWANSSDTCIVNDETVIVSGSSLGYMSIYSLTKDRVILKDERMHTDRITALHTGMLDNRPVVITGGAEGHICTYDIDTGATTDITGIDAVTDLALNFTASDAKEIICGFRSMVRIYNARGNNSIIDIPIDSGGVTTIAWTDFRQKRLIIAGGNDGSLRAWEAVTGKRVLEENYFDTAITSLACSQHSDGSLIVCIGAQDGKVIITGTDNEKSLTFSEKFTSDDRIPPSDLLNRRALAEHTLKASNQLINSDILSKSRTATILIDGEWGSGKTVLAQDIIELACKIPRPQPPSSKMNADNSAITDFGQLTNPFVIKYNCWRGSKVTPQWWLLTHRIYQAAREATPILLRPIMLLGQLIIRFKTNPAGMLPALFSIFFLILLLPLSAILDTKDSLYKEITHIAGVAAFCYSVGSTVYKGLFWASPIFGSLHMKSDGNLSQEITYLVEHLRKWTRGRIISDKTRNKVRICKVCSIISTVLIYALILFLGQAELILMLFAALAAIAIAAALFLVIDYKKYFASKNRPILLILDDLDRCDSATVVACLETIQTILCRDAQDNDHESSKGVQRSAAPLVILVLADGNWVRRAFIQRYKDFSPSAAATRDLGSEFIQKIFDHIVLIPQLTDELRGSFVKQMTEMDHPKGGSSAFLTPVQDTENRHASQENKIPLDTSGTKAEASEYSRVDSTSHNTQLDLNETERLEEHFLVRYERLMPTNPRQVRRVVNAWTMLRALQSCGIRVTPPDTLTLEELQLRTASLWIQFPSIIWKLTLSTDLPEYRDGKWRGGDPELSAMLSTQAVANLLGLRNKRICIQPELILRCMGR
jgi:KAP family P-loop domain